MDVQMWASVGVSVGALVLSLLINVGIVAYFMGQMKATTAAQGQMLTAFKEFNATTINALAERLKVGDERFQTITRDNTAAAVALAGVKQALESHETLCGERQTRVDHGFEQLNHRIDGLLTIQQAIVRGKLADLTTASPAAAA